MGCGLSSPVHDEAPYDNWAARSKPTSAGTQACNPLPRTSSYACQLADNVLWMGLEVLEYPLVSDPGSTAVHRWSLLEMFPVHSSPMFRRRLLREAMGTAL